MAADPHDNLDYPDTAHEESDVNLRAIIWFVVVLTAIVLVTDVAMWGLFKALAYYDVENDPPVSPLFVGAGKPLPPPGLQTTPWTDLTHYRAEANAYLHSYGWVDEKAGVARIPIEKAKAMLLKQGLPVRPDAVDAAAGTHIAAGGESNGGRTLPAGQPDTSSAPAPATTAPAAPATTAPAAPATTAPAPKKPGGGGQ
jgi:hypothetical protein